MRFARMENQLVEKHCDGQGHGRLLRIESAYVEQQEGCQRARREESTLVTNAYVQQERQGVESETEHFVNRPRVEIQIGEARVVASQERSQTSDFETRHRARRAIHKIQ